MNRRPTRHTNTTVPMRMPPYVERRLNELGDRWSHWWTISRLQFRRALQRSGYKFGERS